MFVVMVRGNWGKPKEQYFIDSGGKKTPYLGKAQMFRTADDADTAGKAFIDQGKGHTFSADPA